MRLAALGCAALLWSCAPSDDSGAKGVLRQALPGLPEKLGTTGSLLGASLASCRGQGFVAGAPGTGTAWLSTTDSMPPGIGSSSSLGRAVACDSSFTELMLAGGATGIRKEAGGTWVGAFTSFPTYAISRSESASLPLLVGHLGSVKFYDPSTETFRFSYASGGANFGSTAVQWFPGTSRFAATHFLGQVGIYDYDPAQPSVSTVAGIPLQEPGFGRSLAVGDFFPQPGEELAIGAAGVVHIYSLSGPAPVRLHQLMGSGDLTFGTSLAVQRGFAPGLDLLFVGEPGSNTVYRFVGSQSFVASALTTPGAGFGASIAIDSPMTTLAIGAPEHQGTGAVFFEQLAPGVGEAMPCALGASCLTSDCQEGLCVGEVFCRIVVVGDVCLPGRCDGLGACLQLDGGQTVYDGGFPFPRWDGGAPDASIDFDAGEVDLDGGDLDASVMGTDAGGVDGGLSDAGISTSDGGSQPEDAGVRKDAGVSDAERMNPVIFSTSGCAGCSGTGALPLALLGLALAKRRRRPRDHFPLRGRGIA